MSPEADTDEQPDESETAGDEDLPEMEADEFADADLDAIADEVEDEAGADEAADQDLEDAPDQAGAESDGGGAESDLGTAGESWGDMYVGTLTTVSNALIEEHGQDGAETIEEDLARQLHLDEYFDEFMDSRGKADMPPEQALLIGTTMFLVVVVGTKTDIPSQVAEEVDF